MPLDDTVTRKGKVNRVWNLATTRAAIGARIMIGLDFARARIADQDPSMAHRIDIIGIEPFDLVSGLFEILDQGGIEPLFHFDRCTVGFIDAAENETRPIGDSLRFGPCAKWWRMEGAPGRLAELLPPPLPQRKPSRSSRGPTE